MDVARIAEVPCVGVHYLYLYCRQWRDQLQQILCRGENNNMSRLQLFFRWGNQAAHRVCAAGAGRSPTGGRKERTGWKRTGETEEGFPGRPFSRFQSS